jgi:hypothetical protein
MSRKRSKYRQKPVITNPLAPIMPMGKARATQCMLAFYTALGEIIAGRHPGRSEWRDLADVCNVVERLVRRGDYPADETMPLIDAASKGMKAAAHQFEDNGQMRLSIDSVLALQSLLKLHQEFLEVFPEREVLLVIAETRADIIEARRHKDVVTL